MEKTYNLNEQIMEENIVCLALYQEMIKQATKIQMNYIQKKTFLSNKKKIDNLMVKLEQLCVDVDKKYEEETKK